jgi:hypothetical protein
MHQQIESDNTDVRQVEQGLTRRPEADAVDEVLATVDVLQSDVGDDETSATGSTPVRVPLSLFDS